MCFARETCSFGSLLPELETQKLHPGLHGRTLQMAAPSTPQLAIPNDSPPGPSKLFAHTVVKAGLLTKEGAFVKNWKSYWFELTPLQMTYYSDNVRFMDSFLCIWRHLSARKLTER